MKDSASKLQDCDELKLPVVLQEEIKVYLQRSLPLCILLANKNYEEWYYSNYIQIFSHDDDEITLLDFIEPRDSYVDVSEVICLGYHMFKQEESFLDFAKGKLKLGYYIIANVDEMELHNKSSYKKEHYVHSSLLYGYNDNERAFYGIGFGRLSAFEYLEFGYNELQNAFSSGMKYYPESCPWGEWSAVQLIKPKTPDIKFIFDKDKFMRDLHSYIYSVPDPYRYYTFGYTGGENVFGIKVYDKVIEKMKENMKENIKTGLLAIDYRAIHLILEHKKGLCNRICFVVNRYRLSGEITEETKKLNELVKSIDKVRLKWLYLDYIRSGDTEEANSVLETLILHMEDIKEKEIPIITKIYKLLCATI